MSDSEDPEVVATPDEVTPQLTDDTGAEWSVVDRPQPSTEPGLQESDPGVDADDPGDIELAYRQALQALDEAERQVGSALNDFAEDQNHTSDDDANTSGLSVGQQLAEELASRNEGDVDSDDKLLVEGLRRVTPGQVIEAALFVGGDVALTARKLASLIGQDVDARVAVSLVDSLNQTYLRQNRPYEIRLHEGGFRLELREQFHDVSLRAFGIGPREVKLSPEVLEVLAYVAYNQPLTKEEMTQIDRPNCMSLLRQLLRLQLVELQRTGEKRTDVSYVTTERFLQLFGLRTIKDLPTADIFSFK
ncbi:MAG: SMC-Scp complex subunit ScpB [Planctomycetaceae bacterium]|nr:SMC-Scp complex subunit ScpB [Planctomycetaceae bacterium]